MRESLELLRLFLNVFLHSLGNSVSYTRIKCCRKNVLVAQFAVINQSSNCVGSSQFHFFGDSGCTSFQSAAGRCLGRLRTLLTWFGKSERPVPTTLAPAAFATIRHDLRNGVCHCEDEWRLYSWLRTISWRYDAGSRHAYEDVSAFQEHRQECPSCAPGWSLRTICFLHPVKTFALPLLMIPLLITHG